MRRFQLFWQGNTAHPAFGAVRGDAQRIARQQRDVIGERGVCDRVVVGGERARPGEGVDVGSGGATDDFPKLAVLEDDHHEVRLLRARNLGGRLRQRKWRSRARGRAAGCEGQADEQRDC